MYRIDNPSAANALPVTKPPGPQGYFTGGNPTTGEQATIVEADFLNTIQEELMTIVSRGAVTPDKTNNTQVLQALSHLFTAAYTQITVTQNLLVPAWATQIAFRIVGGGGGGAHTQSNGTSYTSGAGGGSGGYAEAQRPVTPGQLVNAIIGIGGASEQNGTATSMAFLSDWVVTAGGGAGGIWSAPNNSPGGIGGNAAGGDLDSYGSFGGDGEANGVYATTGYGGPGFWGGGARAGNSANPGQPGAPGLGPGAGGAGVYDNTNSNVYVPGGRGADGVIQYRFLP